MKQENELQRIARESIEKLKKMAYYQSKIVGNWYVSELSSGGGVSPYSTSDIPFDRKYWFENSSSITTTAMIEGTNVGLKGAYVLANIQKTSEYYLDLTIDGVTLSDRLRGSAKYAEELTLETVNTHIKNKTTWKRLTDDLTRQKISKGDLPKYLKELEDYALRVGGNTQELRRLINRANKNIEKLAQNNAPTTRLKRAYERVVGAVESGDSNALSKAMSEALEQKAVYNNGRIARTEIAKAHSKGFARRLVDHPLYKDGNAFVRVNLSSRHNVVDICDHVTGADLYNVGAGVYPAGKAPLIPLHPNCLCQYTITARDVDGRTVKYSKERSEEFLSKQSDRERASIERSMSNLEIKKLNPLPKDQVKPI